jgi:hypothetical protein
MPATARITVPERISRSVFRNLTLRMAVAALAPALVLLALPATSGASHVPRCFGKRATIVSAAATVVGTKHADVIIVERVSGATVYGRGGSDRICGGPGPDRLHGGPGPDRLRGGGGADRLIGGAGRDRFSATGQDHSDAVAGEPVNGRSRTVIAHRRRHTVATPSDAVASATPPGRGLQTVVLRRGVRAPQVGRVMVSPVGAGNSQGVLGRVVSTQALADGRTAVNLEPATLDQAYSSYSVALDGDFGSSASRAHGADPRALGGNFDCTSGSGLGPTVEVRLDLSKLHWIIALNALNPYLEVFVTGQPQLSLNLAFHGQVHCAAKRSLPVMIPLPGTPLTLNVRPEFSFTVGGSLAASATWAPHIAYGFIRSLHEGNSDFHVFRSDGGISFSGGASLEAFLGMNLELALGGRIGVGGTIGPTLKGTFEALPDSCFTVDGAFRGQLTASANVIFKDWEFALATVTFGRTQLFHHCASDGGGTGSDGGSSSGGGGSSSGGGGDPSAIPPASHPETAGGVTHTWTNYANAGGTQGPSIQSGQTVGVSCKVQGFQVQDGDTWWYRIAASPWNDAYYASADAFYNNGATSGSLIGTPFVDGNVPDCQQALPPPPPTWSETVGGNANTWTNYTNAGGTQGPTIPGYTTVQIACKLQGFRVADGNTWWYRIASSPWNSVYYVSADAFYNNGQTSGSLIGTPFVDNNVADC